MLRNIKIQLKKLIKYRNRNNVAIQYNVKKTKNNSVNLEYCNRDPNVGDIISPVICEWMMNRLKLKNSKEIGRKNFPIAST